MGEIQTEIVMEIFQGKTSVSEVSRQYDLTPAQIEEWMEEARKGMENDNAPNFQDNFLTKFISTSIMPLYL